MFEWLWLLKQWFCVFFFFFLARVVCNREPFDSRLPRSTSSPIIWLIYLSKRFDWGFQELPKQFCPASGLIEPDFRAHKLSEFLRCHLRIFGLVCRLGTGFFNKPSFGNKQWHCCFFLLSNGALFCEETLVEVSSEAIRLRRFFSLETYM